MKLREAFLAMLLTVPGSPCPAEPERPLRSLDSNDFDMAPVRSLDEWATRSEEIRNRVQLAAGLWPMPERQPVKPVVHGRMEREGYTIDRVFFESYPGHFVTGNLYLPSPVPESMPGILCPHGHWPEGRFMDASESTGHRSVEAQIESGGESRVNAARSPLQARCVHLARMGCAVFHYDMLGYADSMQIPEHRSGAQDDLKGMTPGEYGLYSVAAELRLQTSFGLHTFNSLRALDFLESLSGVDSTRLGVTGASGGATQTLMITAIDDRVKASFPCVMVSTSMQGGCTCENAPYLRISQGNVDIAAAAAPRPLGLTAADDWTIELETKGYPDLLALYRLLDVEDNLTALFATQFKHNYNQVSREAMYRFFNEHFELGIEETGLKERDFAFTGPEELTVWTEEHPAPAGANTGEAHEKVMLKAWSDASDQVIEGLLSPEDPAGVNEMRRVIGGAWKMMVGRELSERDDYRFDVATQEKSGGILHVTGICQDLVHGESVHIRGWYPDQWSGELVIWLRMNEVASLPDALAGVVESGAAVVTPELHAMGIEQAPSVNPEAETDPDSWRASACYTYGYNASVFAKRVHDVLTVLGARPGKTVSILAERDAAAIGAAAAFLAGESVGRLVADVEGVSFGAVESIWDPAFVPGALKYGDLSGLLAACAPAALSLTGEVPDAVRKTYGVLGSESMVETLGGGDLGALAGALTAAGR